MMFVELMVLVFEVLFVVGLCVYLWLGSGFEMVEDEVEMVVLVGFLCVVIGMIEVWMGKVFLVW